MLVNGAYHMSISLTLVTTQADFEDMHQGIDKATDRGIHTVTSVDREALSRLLIDHSALVSHCRKHGLRVIEPEGNGRKRVPLKT
jgi:hypothetical protein